jgi:LmbE family N-acetylglucosaminyl deacetylase
MSEVIVLSPHLDDAVFDCWQVINQSGTTVLTVFAGLPKQGTSKLWDKLCGQADSKLMVLRRRQENDTALRGTSASISYLDFLDNQYRSEPLLLDKIVKEIIDNTPSNSRFLAPLAGSRLLRHPDHVLLRQASLILKRSGHDVSFFPDIPYMRLPRRATPTYLHRLSGQSSKLLGFPVSASCKQLSADQQHAKRQAILAYKSQYKMTNITSFGRLSRLAKRDFEVILEPTG